MVNRIIGHFKQKRIEAEEARAREQSELRAADEDRVRQEAQIRQIQQNILALVDDDKVPEVDWEAAVGRPLPFRFQKSEYVLYVFPLARYLEQRTKREIVGRSVGTSVRVAKGVSVRAGGSRGTPVESDEIVDRGVGMLAVTSKHIYFNGDRVFRIAFNKIVAVEPSGDDAVIVTRDRASAHPEFFVVGSRDGWFAYELLQAVPSLEIPRGGPEVQSPNDYHLLVMDGGDYIVDDTS